ncbi:DUF4064 domain-containing protein [Virgibacillus kimchii]
MKRTAELVLGIIGTAIDFIFFIGLGILLLLINIGVGWSGMERYLDDVLSSFLLVLLGALWIPVISSFVSFVLGLIAVIKVSGSPKLSGGLFIAAAVISSWLMFSGMLFQSLFYLAAGILCFVRKDPEKVSV